MSQKKYISLSKLSTFLDNLKNTFASLTHSHTVSDLTDYAVDTELSSTSTNPVANSTLNEEFEAVSTAMSALESAIDSKADASHSHDDLYYTESEIDSKVSTLNDAIDGKSDTDHTHPEATQNTAGLLSASNKIQLDYGGAPIVTTSGDGSAYTATVDGMNELTKGMSFTMIPHVVSASIAPTLNVNNLGAKTIRRRVSNSIGSTAAGYNTSWLAVNKPIRVEYDGMFWIVDLPRPSAADMSGTLKVANGGTGRTSVTADSFLVGNGTDAMVEKTPEDVLNFIGAAPSGYGLGATAYYLPACDDANSAVNCGWYNASSGMTNGVGVSGVMRVDSYAADSIICQTFYSGAYSSSYPIICQRWYRSGGGWDDEWSWVNPPMVSGVEYRTTERYNGKPVYAMLVYCGNLPAADDESLGEKAVYAPTTKPLRLVDFKCSVFNEECGDVIIDVTNIGITLNDGVTEIYITTTQNMSHYDCYVLLKYIQED